MYDTESIRRFVGVELSGIPDESTNCRFRHRLEKERLTEKLFKKVEGYLSDKGLIVSEGTIVDATIVDAHSSTKNQDRKRDPEMKQTKKGNQWRFGMKAHVGTDTEGKVHSIAVTDASVHDSQIMESCCMEKNNVFMETKPTPASTERPGRKHRASSGGSVEKPDAGRSSTARIEPLTGRAIVLAPNANMPFASSRI